MAAERKPPPPRTADARRPRHLDPEETIELTTFAAAVAAPIAGVVKEPLPDRMTALLRALESKQASRR